MDKLNPDRLFPADPTTRAIARNLYQLVKDLPIISPHGHTDPKWFADNVPFADPASLLLTPDHYVFRMLYSQGIKLEEFGVARVDGGATERDSRKIWRLFAQHYYLFRGTPSRMWFDWVLSSVFDAPIPLTPENADSTYDRIAEKLQKPEFRPRALFERFNIEALATTESPLDDLLHHVTIRKSGWRGRVITAYRPDNVVDPDAVGFLDNLKKFSELTGEDALSWRGYIAAHRKRRAFFAVMGATSTDHGHPTARTADLSPADAEALFMRIVQGRRQSGRRGPVPRPDAHGNGAHESRRQARAADPSGCLAQSQRAASSTASARTSAPTSRPRTDYVGALRPLLNRYGNDPSLTIIVFTLDESSYARELAPLAGHYPALKLGPAWWFHDSPGRHDAFPRADHGNRRLLQHRGFQRRHARVSLDPVAPRRGTARRLFVPRAPGRRAPAAGRRGRDPRAAAGVRIPEESLQTLIAAFSRGTAG